MVCFSECASVWTVAGFARQQHWGRGERHREFWVQCIWVGADCLVWWAAVLLAAVTQWPHRSLGAVWQCGGGGAPLR